MEKSNRSSAFILGLCLILALSSLGFLLANAALDYKQLDRSVRVKGLSEREFSADIVIWPIQFTAADNSLSALYQRMEDHTKKITDFLMAQGFKKADISYTSPAIIDKSAQQYSSNGASPFRYTGTQTVTVYSEQIDTARSAMKALSELGKQGIVISGANYDSRTEYLFTRLNAVKPEMIEEATRKAREVAEKFASDSNSQLGKIKRASQGQFSIMARDTNNPHIKRVRVVSTVEYYLAD